MQSNNMPTVDGVSFFFISTPRKWDSNSDRWDSSQQTEPLCHLRRLLLQLKKKHDFDSLSRSLPSQRNFLPREIQMKVAKQIFWPRRCRCRQASTSFSHRREDLSLTNRRFVLRRVVCPFEAAAAAATCWPRTEARPKWFQCRVGRSVWPMQDERKRKKVGCFGEKEEKRRSMIADKWRLKR